MIPIPLSQFIIKKIARAAVNSRVRVDRSSVIFELMRQMEPLWMLPFVYSLEIEFSEPYAVCRRDISLENSSH